MGFDVIKLYEFLSIKTSLNHDPSDSSRITSYWHEQSSSSLRGTCCTTSSRLFPDENCSVSLSVVATVVLLCSSLIRRFTELIYYRFPAYVIFSTVVIGPSYNALSCWNKKSSGKLTITFLFKIVLGKVLKQNMLAPFRPDHIIWEPFFISKRILENPGNFRKKEIGEEFRERWSF